MQTKGKMVFATNMQASTKIMAAMLETKQNKIRTTNQPFKVLQEWRTLLEWQALAPFEVRSSKYFQYKPWQN